MLPRLISLLVLGLGCFLSLARAHSIEIAAGAKECFFEDLHTEDKMTVTYQVGEGGHLDIDFWLKNPSSTIIYSQHRQPTGTYSFTADQNGRYQYCFSNEMSSMSPKIVSFNVHGVIYIADDGQTAPIERQIRELADSLQDVKDEQEYIVVRERVHRNTAESTNSRIKYWSIFQALALIGVCAWQVYYLKAFFEVKRVI
ncbi:copii-coated vesicle protein [Phaffia rhodozyma]|uniref:Copii-coated vesicle protein n=1 Tax=Phaffia rhodozyma TaxID=264483 RepID=A0A0F7SGG6_PHARH|nr:copii-coated vesicle protein [Phaffia rhodozyma]